VLTSAPFVLVSAADAEFEVEADADFEDFEVEADGEEDDGFEVDGLVLLDVPAAGDDFGLLDFFVGLVCMAPPVCAQLVLDDDAVGVADLLAFALPVAMAVAAAVAVGVAFGESEPDALAVPVDGLTGGLLVALDDAPGLVVVAGGLVRRAGLLVFGDVRGDEVGDADAAGQDGAAAATWLDAAAVAALVVAPAAAEPTAPLAAPRPDPPLPLLLLLLCPVNTEELS
jgi:hypothetical protein